MSKTIEIMGHASDDSISNALDTAQFRSVSHTEIVHVYAEAGAAQAAEDALTSAADDSVETKDGDGRRLIEAWGSNDDGDEWRVHLHVRSEEETAERRSDRGTV